MAKKHNHVDFILKWSNHEDLSLAREKVNELTERLIQETGQGLDLSEAELSDCRLGGLNLRRAKLNRARLYRTDLSYANLTEATLICPGMERTNLKGANLKGAYIHALAAQVCNFERTRPD
jgi:uncharacterized protein YjbI with pentapeptide repeats